jgi:hypothetical protein
VRHLLEREEISLAPSSEAEVRRLVAELNEAIARANSHASSGPPTRIAPLDPDDAARRWRARREGGSEPPPAS